MQENKMIRYRSAILLALFIGIFILFFIFLVNLAQKIGRADELKNKIVKIENKAVRGKIISADNFVLAHSSKLFRAEVHSKSIDPKMKDVFIQLFSIYSKISREEIEAAFVDKRGKAKKGYVYLTDNLDYRLASDLKSLSHKMMKLKIFRPIDKHKPHLINGLDIVPSKEKRYFPHTNSLTPVIGYVRKTDERYRKVQGMKGLEKEYAPYLLAEKDGLVQGMSDSLRTPLQTGASRSVPRIDGLDLYLNIELSFQKKVEEVLDEMKEQTAGEEVMAAVMNSRTGELLALATSERFNPAHIYQKDVKALNPNFSEYLYEPGSVIKPLTMAIALDKNKVDLSKQIRLGGKLQVSDRYSISDDEFFRALTPKGIIMYSSNIGIAKIAWRLTGQELYDGWKKFGLTLPSGIDLSKELSGRLKPPAVLNRKVASGNMAYGYGMLANFMQLIKAYSAFNNEGVAVTPKIVKYMIDPQGQKYYPTIKSDVLKACSRETAKTINDMLQGTVNRGTGTSAQYDGLEVGGKTGTAHIYNWKLKKYMEKYHSSFFGFANDKFGHKYTIGVFVIRPKKVYFASQTAAPTFHKIIGKMVDEKYLTVDKALAKKHLAKRKVLRAKKHAAYVRKIQAYNKKHGIK